MLLLLRPRSAQDKDSSVGRNLENLLVFLPTPSMDNSDVVFLIAKAEFLHPETYVFAIDTRNKHLQDLTMELKGNFVILSVTMVVSPRTRRVQQLLQGNLFTAVISQFH